jgi:thiamine-phosphate pyrophosphorylase
MTTRRFFHDATRIIDANFNRAKEGLRVCEDIARFHLRNKTVTAAIGCVRHGLTLAIKQAAISEKELLRARDSAGDPARTSTLGPSRKNFKEIFLANAQRVKEALRVLEEFTKLFDGKASRRLQRLRFQFYDCEKQAARRFPSLSDPR